MIIVREKNGELQEVGRLKADYDLLESLLQDGEATLHRYQTGLIGSVSARESTERWGKVVTFAPEAAIKLRACDGSPFREATGHLALDHHGPVAEVISGAEHLDQVKGFERTGNP